MNGKMCYAVLHHLEKLPFWKFITWTRDDTASPLNCGFDGELIFLSKVELQQSRNLNEHQIAGIFRFCLTVSTVYVKLMKPLSFLIYWTGKVINAITIKVFNDHLSFFLRGFTKPVRFLNKFDYWWYKRTAEYKGCQLLTGNSRSFIFPAI